jgi:hypothetical protein
MVLIIGISNHELLDRSELAFDWIEP